jgi:predicted RNase H-like nuclease (RuvC/YqgF family)
MADDQFQTAPSPRQRASAPKPTPSKQPSRIPQQHNASVTAFEEKIIEYKSENSLLGGLLQDSQAQCAKLDKLLQTAHRKAIEAQRRHQEVVKKLEKGTRCIDV